MESGCCFPPSQMIRGLTCPGRQGPSTAPAHWSFPSSLGAVLGYSPCSVCLPALVLTGVMVTRMSFVTSAPALETGHLSSGLKASAIQGTNVILCAVLQCLVSPVSMTAERMGNLQDSCVLIRLLATSGQLALLHGPRPAGHSQVVCCGSASHPCPLP